MKECRIRQSPESRHALARQPNPTLGRTRSFTQPGKGDLSNVPPQSQARASLLDGALAAAGVIPLVVASLLGVGCSSGAAGAVGAQPEPANAGTGSVVGPGPGGGSDSGPNGSGAGGMGSAGGPSATSPLDIGTKAIHRLGSIEYDNTVRDLLGTAKTFGSGFASEEADGFDNVAEALTM